MTNFNTRPIVELMKILLFDKDVGIEVRIFRWLFLTGMGALPWLVGVSLYFGGD